MKDFLAFSGRVLKIFLKMCAVVAVVGWMGATSYMMLLALEMQQRQTAVLERVYSDLQRTSVCRIYSVPSEPEIYPNNR